MIDWSKERVLVTGAQGFIGSWVASRLLDEGATVVIPRRDEPAQSRFKIEGLAARCDIVQVDLIDHQGLIRALNEHSISTVFHLAAQTIVGIANRSPHSTFESNIRGTYNLLEACRVTGEVGDPIKRIIVASSDKAYGSHEVLPYREDFELKAIYPYDVSKACTDMISRSYAVTYGLPVAVTRLANVYGGGDFNMSRVVPDTVQSLLKGQRPVIRSDGSPQRDYIYAPDAAAGYLTVAESLEDDSLRGKAWNLGAGQLVSVLDIVQRLIAVTGADVEPDIQGSGVPDGEIDRQQLDSTAISEKLGWAPQWSLDDGLAETYRWYERVLS
ncbi:MAG: CDP-glucose 4,6-dehydratase [Thermoleophilaceae bacterium]|jgi:CDP-glucose 4,6-dehydratase|nr:CDP-glucose 4,6-dehydratase [Thermoleophilaceae bacterium]